MNNKHLTPLHRLDKPLAWLIPLIALTMVLFHVIIVWYPVFGGVMTQNTHLGFCLVLIPLHWARMSDRFWEKALCWLGAIFSLAIVTYLAVHYERLDMEAGFPEPTDVVVGITLIIIVLVATWRSFGAVFPVLVLVAISYALWGQYIPGVMGHPPFEFGFVVSSLSVGFQGIFGMLLNVSVNMLFLLVIFGSIFEATGITHFFMEFGKWIGRYLPGGAGHMAIFSSSFVGMVNGAAGANVAITGSFTIPVMKKAGFRSETAGGIEAMASTGGQLTPPIMGIAVFVMAGFLGISYAELMFKAIIPAVAYYMVAIAGVIIIAFKEKIPMIREPVDRKVLVSGTPLFLIPIAVLTTIMLLHYSAGYAAFWSIVTLLLVSFLRRHTRPSLKVLLRNLVQGAIMAGTFGIAIGCIGMLIKCLTFTGAATKLSLVVGMVSSGNLLVLLILIMLLSILLSSSTPTVIAYIIVAFVAAPVLVENGIPIITAHLFVFYFAILAAVTPPVAGAAMVACKIAGAGYLKTSWESFKLVGPFYLLPFFIINNPILLSEAQPFAQATMAIVALAIALVGMICFFQGFFFVPVNRLERILFLTAALLATWYGLHGNVYFFMLALVQMIGLLVYQGFKLKHVKVSTGEIDRLQS
ncbi:MAG: TRAP transporter fused permease subunit [SAR324 cluster bacterium]|nr:TRAP transporter fused permease subunit [SAR324 cluster bacterium]